MIITIVIIIIAIILAIWFYPIYFPMNKEGFIPDYQDRIPPFNGEDYYDTLFDDVIYFPNEIDPNTGIEKMSGYLRCKNNCAGNCVEYGPTGNSYCFPY